MSRIVSAKLKKFVIIETSIAHLSTVRVWESYQKDAWDDVRMDWVRFDEFLYNEDFIHEIDDAAQKLFNGYTDWNHK